MQLLEHLTTWLVGWLSIAAVGGLAWCVCVTRYKSRQRADEAELRQRADITRKAHYPPPVPRPTTPPFWQTLPDPAWFDGIPADCLSDDAVHSLFDSIVAGEFK